MQRNARDGLGLAKHDNDALVNKDGYASEEVSEVQNDDEPRVASLPWVTASKP